MARAVRVSARKECGGESCVTRACGAAASDRRADQEELHRADRRDRPTGLNVDFTGELTAYGEAGTAIGASPATVTFKGAESGELETSIEGAKGTFMGKPS